MIGHIVTASVVNHSLLLGLSKSFIAKGLIFISECVLLKYGWDSGLCQEILNEWGFLYYFATLFDTVPTVKTLAQEILQRASTELRDAGFFQKPKAEVFEALKRIVDTMPKDCFKDTPVDEEPVQRKYFNTPRYFTLALCGVILAGSLAVLSKIPLFA